MSGVHGKAVAITGASSGIGAATGRLLAERGAAVVLVSNAGISKIGPMADLDVDGWSATIDVNVRGVLNGIAAALPVFRRQGRGHLVTTV
jgi:NADP-dependent 3-hydroxy acid dehydrogenase YdfG